MSFSSARTPKSLRVGARRLGGLALVFATVAATLTAFSPPAPAEAATAADFQPGFIISDDLFYDGDSMTEAQIQSFLDQRIGTCANGRCLNVLRVNLPTYPAHTSSTTGNLVCDTVQGGTNILASTVIFRVQQACNISAKVILVTLQKEQGLILSKSPSNYALNFAMGWACPDTTGCTDASSWFGYQVYRGSRQLVTYKLANFARQPGVHNIQFHPDPSCGSTPVNIRNFATAALYNYTPYQPSSAALAAFPGPAAGTCHSYGNRNFFFFYNQWFGSTFSVDGPFALNQAYADAGGATGALGAQVAASSCVVGNTSCWREYANGYIGWRSSTGTVVVTGDIFTSYKSRGGPAGPMGLPLAPSSFFTTTSNGDGFVQVFQGGYLYASSAGVWRVVTGTSSDQVWANAGWIRGSLGWPVADERCTAGACSQEFQNGVIGRSSSGRAFTIDGVIATYFKERGGSSGSLGQPLAAASTFTTTSNGNGQVQIFQGGHVYSSAAGVFTVKSGTPVGNAWAAAGWIRGSLGWPIAEESCSAGVCTQQFQGGTIRGSTIIPSVTDAAILAYWNSRGGASGALGNPTNAVATFTTTSNGNGQVQIFQGGYVYSSASGVFTVKHGVPVGNTWANAGWIRGSLGWPIAEESCSAGVCTQQFQGGTVRGTTIIPAV